jgi:hypothetical protein
MIADFFKRRWRGNQAREAWILPSFYGILAEIAETHTVAKLSSHDRFESDTNVSGY